MHEYFVQSPSKPPVLKGIIIYLSAAPIHVMSTQQKAAYVEPVKLSASAFKPLFFANNVSSLFVNASSASLKVFARFLHASN